LPPIQIGFVHAIFQLLVCYIYCNIIQHLQDNFLGSSPVGIRLYWQH
jgi:hypothetical protein